jgi:hypothetical protein
MGDSSDSASRVGEWVESGFNADWFAMTIAMRRQLLSTEYLQEQDARIKASMFESWLVRGPQRTGWWYT